MHQGGGPAGSSTPAGQRRTSCVCLCVQVHSLHCLQLHAKSVCERSELGKKVLGRHMQASETNCGSSSAGTHIRSTAVLVAAELTYAFTKNPVRAWHTMVSEAVSTSNPHVQLGWKHTCTSPSDATAGDAPLKFTTIGKAPSAHPSHPLLARRCIKCRSSRGTSAR